MAKTIVIFSTKGGVGKTLIASNIAASLAKDHKKKICLVDLDMHAPGDMSRVLNLNPQKAMVDFISIYNRHPDAPLIENFITASPFGVDFIPGVLRPKHSSLLDSDGIKHVFNLLDEKYDFIIVDAGSNFSDIFLTTLNQANLILLIATPDVLAVYQTKWILDTLQVLHFPLAMLKVVLNRAESASSISWKDIKGNLPIEIIAMIPSEGKLVGQSLNRGVPAVIDSPKAKFSQNIKKLVIDLTSSEDLFLSHKEIDKSLLKDAPLNKPGTFWQEQGLAGGLDDSEEEEVVDEVIQLKKRIHTRLIEELNLKRMDLREFSDSQKTRELRARSEALVANLLTGESGTFIASQDVRNKLIKEILDEALGLGPLEDLLADPYITDIMVNNKDEIYIERKGKIELTSKKFISNEQVKTIIERIIAPLGRRIDESVPLVDARLPDGSRVNAIIPPLSLTGPTLTIRKFRKERFTVEELIGLKSLSYQMAEFLKACVASRKNIIVSGGTGSGKTTVLNVLSGFIPEGERIVTIEDAAELKLHQRHWIRLESRPPNIESKGEISIRELFRNSLRMRPDRVVIGECRGVETLDMLQAMNTGHDGSMTTIHANSTQDVLTRIDSMILMSDVELPIRAIREMIASAVNVIVHTARLSDGTRRIIQITEITGMADDMHIGLKDIFAFKQTGVDEYGNAVGEYKASGFIPTFFEDIRIRGIQLDEAVFKA